jgi:hypothetical protein
VTVTATLYYSASFANMLGSAPGNIAHNYRIRIGDGAAQATQSRDVEALTSHGPRQSSVSYSGRILRSGQSNIGNFLWLLNNGNLTLLRPEEAGDFKLTVSFADSDRGLICAANAPYPRESGAATDLLEVAFGGKVVITDMVQIGSTCVVSRT